MKVHTAGINLLSKWMRDNGLTQEAAGARLGATGVAVSLWLSADRRPNIDSATRIAERTSGAVPASAWAEKLPVRRPSRRSRNGSPQHSE